MPISPNVVRAIVDAAEAANQEACKRALNTLKAASGLAGAEIVKAPYRANVVKSSFQIMEGRFDSCVALAARFSDLVVFNPECMSHHPDLTDAFIETLVKTERPILLARRAPKVFPGKVVIAWDGSDTAARALVGAIPILEKTAEIVLLTCCDDAEPGVQTRDAGQYLALHGLSCTSRTIETGKRTVGEALLSTCADNGADLLVMGGFGHSRLGEAIFGGVTQHIRWHATVPVLMVH